jgi:preprotein translocase subunit SecD
MKMEGNTEGIIRIFRAIAVVVCAGLLGYFVYATTTQFTESKYPFKLGLDLAGGSHLVYEADVSSLSRQKFLSS